MLKCVAECVACVAMHGASRELGYDNYVSHCVAGCVAVCCNARRIAYVRDDKCVLQSVLQCVAEHGASRALRCDNHVLHLYQTYIHKKKNIKQTCRLTNLLTLLCIPQAEERAAVGGRGGRGHTCGNGLQKCRDIWRDTNGRYLRMMAVRVMGCEWRVSADDTCLYMYVNVYMFTYIYIYIYTYIFTYIKI